MRQWEFFFLKKKDKLALMFRRKSLRRKMQKMFENVKQPSRYQCQFSQGQELMTEKDPEPALKSPVLQGVSEWNYRSEGAKEGGVV